MIGSKVVIGFDGTSVMRGFASIGKAFGKLGGTIGRGAMERVGHRMTDLMGRIISAIPEAISETMDFAGEMNDLSKATDTSVKSLVEMREMLRLGGAESVDTGRMLANLSKQLYKANEEGGAAADALHALGMATTDFDGKNMAESFEMIANAVGNSKKGTGELVDILGELFGGRIGYKTIPLMKEFATTQQRAAKSTGVWGAYLEKNAEAMDKMGDAFGRWQQFKMGIASMLIEGFQRMPGGGVDAFFDFLNPEKVRPRIQELFNLIGRNLEVFLSTDFKTLAKGFGESIGESIGNGIKKSLGDIMPSGADIFGGLKGMVGLSDKTTSASGVSSRQAAEQISLLRDIRSKVGVTSIA